MFRWIDMAVSALVVLAATISTGVDAKTFNLYPYPIETRDGVVYVTASYGDTGEHLPIHFLGRDARLSSVDLNIGSVAPHAEVFWSPEREDFRVLYGRNRRVSSPSQAGKPPCRMFEMHTQPTFLSIMKEVDDEQCNLYLREGYPGFSMRSSLDWLGSPASEAKFNEVTRFRTDGGNRFTIVGPESNLGFGFLYPDGAILLLNSGYFVASGSNYEQLTVNLKGTSLTVSQFYDVLHRPDVVRAALAGEDTQYLVGDLTLTKAVENPPPKIVLGGFAGSANKKRLKIPYTITPDTGGVAEVRIFQNGKLISSDGTYKDAPGKTYAPVAGKSADAGRYAEANLQRNAKRVEESDGKSSNLRDQLIVRGAPEKKCTPGKAGDPCKGEIEVDVIPGEENTITVVAFNRDNTIQSVPASVSFKSTLPKEDPHLWVIGVGIDQFANISALKNAHKDAQDFICTYVGKEQVSKIGVACAEDGKAKTLFKPQSIHVVDALFDAQATKSNILTALDKVARQAKPGDTFVWFVASHGMMDANSNFGIVAHDTQCLNDNCTDIKGHLTSNEILEASKKIKAMKQLVVLDTCHSGGLDSKLSGLYDARVSLLAKNMGLHLYAGAQATEAAQDGKPGTNGTFTAQLLEGIKGAAPKNQEGQISVMTLGDYAKQKTVEATQPKSGAKDARPAQTPVIQHFGQDAGLVAVGGR